MAKELEKTLLVDGEEYNINAKQAEKVEQALVLKKNLLTTVSEDSFDGTTQKEIDFVPASGGSFTGNIRVPNNTDSKVNDKAVLNYYDLKNTVLKELKNNSVLYTWDGKTLVGGGESDLIKTVSIITGDTGNVNSFAAKNATTKQFSAFIYVGDTGGIYFGTSDSSSVVGVTVSAENAIKANQLAEPRTFGVDLGSGVVATSFDGTNDVTLGVTGTLPVNRGGTGATTAAAARTNLGLAAVASTGKYSDLTDTPNYAGSASAGGAANSALQATKDSAGNVISSYYQKKITLSPNTPSGGSNGDIWIKY